MRFKLKRICPVYLLFVVTSVFAVPGQAFGQSVDSRYCPNPGTDFFKGSIHYENGEPWIETIVDPDFEQKVLRGERKIGGDIPLTPVYDLVVRIKPEFNYYCIPGWAGSASSVAVTADKLPVSITVRASIVVGSKDEEVVTPGFLVRTNTKDEQGRFIYEMKLKGWSQGITDEVGMEKLISAVTRNDKINVLLEITKSDGTVEKLKSPISFSNCAPLSGGSPHSVVLMRGKSMGVSPFAMRRSSDEVRETGFEKIQPFRKYSLRRENSAQKSYFAHFIDLSNHDDTTWAMLLNKFFIMANSRPKKISACGSEASQYFFLTSRPQSGLNYAPYGNRVAFVSTPTVAVAMHEMGHSFAGLEDEYRTGYDVTVYYANCAPASYRPGISMPTTNEQKILFERANSAPRNTDLTFLKRAYWDPYGDTVKGCSTNTQFRPSVRSLMNSNGFDSEEFNVPSCVWILKAIKGRSSAGDWQECMALDGLEKPTSRADVVSFSPSAIFALFNKQLAAVGALADTISADSDAPFINLEYFSPSGKEIRNEIYTRVSGNGDDALWKVVEPTDPPAESIDPGAVIMESLDPSDPWGGVIKIVPDTSPTDSIVPGTVIVDPIDEIFAGVDSASFPIFDPELFDALEQEIAASGEPELSLWQRFLNFFWPDDVSKTPLINVDALKRFDPSNNVVTISACGEITTSGNYRLDRDISATDGDCLYIHDVTDVYLNCDGYRIQSSKVGASVNVSHVNNYSMESCVLKKIPYKATSPFDKFTSSILQVTSSLNGFLGNNTFLGDSTVEHYVVVTSTQNTAFTRNTFNVPYEQHASSRMLLEGNTFDPSYVSTENSYNLQSVSGSRNTFVNNVLDGKSDGIAHQDNNKLIGYDDGIMIGDESGDLVLNNVLKNYFDCGIETLGLISDTSIIGNSVTNTGVCGIGAWYWNSWVSNTVSNNVVVDTPDMFRFYRSYGFRPSDTAFRFQDNKFLDNLFINPRLSPTPFGGYNPSSSFYMHVIDVTSDQISITPDKIFLSNNTFTGNNFGILPSAPTLDPPSMIVDGGGNICGETPSTYPLRCITASPTNTDTQNTPKTSLWQRFLNFFWPPDTSAPVPDDQNPLPPLVSMPVLLDANGIPIGASGNAASGQVTIRGIITVPGNASFSKVTSTFQYAPGREVFVDWVSFTLPTGLKAGEKATDSYTWQAGTGNWRFRLCMDSDSGRVCGDELSVLFQGSISSTPLPASVIGPRLVPHVPLWSGQQTGTAGELYAGPMTLRTEVQNTGDAAADAVNGRFEYSQNGTTFTPWITFSVPSLSPEAKTSASYSWQGGTGIFYMRSCVGAATCSSPVKAEIISAGS